MEILVKDGIKFMQPDFIGRESDFEKIVFSNFQFLFGSNSILFTKQKIRTSTGVGTIPDAFVMDFENEKWYIVEVEISNHDVYMHVVPQLTKFSSTLNNPLTRKQLIKYFDTEINSNPSFKNLLLQNGKSEFYKSISEIVERQPELIIIIEKKHEELSSISNSLPFKKIISVFKVFCRNGANSFDDAIFSVTSIFQKIKRTQQDSSSLGISTAPRQIESGRNQKEIDKVKKRVPKWLNSPNQANHRILVQYFDLKRSKDSVSFVELQQACSGIENFQNHYVAMKNFGEKNHGKVFEEINKEIFLWEPVKSFITTEYEKFKNNN
jgi:hypothetical protein